jgi:hydrogenase maturation factor
MNLVYGEIAEIFLQDGMRMGKVRVAGAVKKIPLELLTNVQPGDKVLLCDGVAIGKVSGSAKRGTQNVPGDSGEVG